MNNPYRLSSVTEYSSYPVLQEVPKHEIAKLYSTPVSFDRDENVLSKFEDDTWDFSAYILARSPDQISQAVWNFSGINRAFKDQIKKALYLTLFTKERRLQSSINALYRVFNGLKQIAIELEELGFTSLFNLSHNKCQNALLNYFSVKNYSVRTITSRLLVCNDLHRLGLINFSIDNVTKLAERTCNGNAEIRQTLAIPQRLANLIYSEAIKTVEKYYPLRYEIAEVLSVYHERTRDKQPPREIRRYLRKKNLDGLKIAMPGYAQHTGGRYNWVNVRDFYCTILCDCGVLIGALSGLRVGEWYELQKQSFKRETVLGQEYCLLVGKTSKLEGGIPKKKAWVTAPISEKVIELLSVITEPQRVFIQNRASEIEKSKPEEAKRLLKASESLFLSYDDRAKVESIKSQVLRKYMKKLVVRANAVVGEEDMLEHKTLNPSNVEMVKSGEHWPLLPHQLRRTFAVFLIRNGFGSLVQVKEQLGHHRLAMSAWYAKNSNAAMQLDYLLDNELRSEIDQCSVELMTDLGCSIFLGDENLSGLYGEKISQDRKNGVLIYSSRDEVKAAIEKGELSIVDNGTSYCLNPSCDRICSSIDPATNALLCKHEILTDSLAKKRLAMRDRLIQRFQEIKELRLYQPNLVSKIKIGITSCEYTLRQHGLSFKPFDFNS
ncbi:tyrosine-type recombinase/integrase [Alteromonas macleodii]|uniref:tyrosine-type recombinase/integrase n=1 Tax=Alteromonas macleodii TaxID=28108 RepID=UPI003CFD80D3